MQSLSALFTKQKEQEHRYIDEKTVFYVFARVINDEYGAQGKKNVIPRFYKEGEGVLFLSFGSSLWAQEVWMGRRRIIRTLNEHLGREVIKDIKTSH